MGATSGVRRGPKASLTAEAIARAALLIADTSGLWELTMKRLAKALRVGEMTLYGYFRSKDEILDAITDLALSEVVLPSRGAWDLQLRQLFLNLHDTLVRHPSIAYLDRTRPTSGPAGLKIADRVLGLLADGSIDDDIAFLAHRALHTFTIGTVLFHVSRGSPAPDAFLGNQRALMQVMADDGYQNIARHLERYRDEGTLGQLRRELDFGLDSLIEALRSSSGPAHS